ncbi:xanthine dehydrogenase family protein molybdopterin-binding subunit [Metaclostridioides mangenotii]|uniref:xanthine dehydrogenase family protein molybdopterin-binding subunit n=1 Tax=Metaclostridioides mangenotii TaxID=1540 RepID=UPI0026E9D3F5|nr:molybdopterin cofactor-binding domain-containing protein [Clostridioides mangenotii]
MEKVIGKSYPVKDAALKVTGQMKYVSDLKPQNVLHAKMLLSPVAHAKIKNIDVSDALKVEGVRAVATHLNSPCIKYNGALRFFEHDIPKDEAVFNEIVRYVGDRVAAVAAETVEAAEKAVSLIKVEYEELPAVLTIQDAIKEGADLIHGDTNKIAEMKIDAGNVDEAFEECDHVFEDEYNVPAIHHGAIETHSAIAHYNYNNNLTVYTPCQNTFAFRIILSQIFEMPLHKIRVVRPAIGGSFGGKLEMTIEPVSAVLSKMTMRPVKLVLNRRESIIATRTRHGAYVKIKTGVKNDGEILAQNIDIYTNTGAYASSALNVMGALSHKVYKVYKIPNMRFKGIPVYTNTPIAGAMRGYGSPQVFMAQQAQIGKIAKTLGLDLTYVQEKNVAEPDGVDVRFNAPLGNPRILDCIEKGKELFGWDEKKRLPKEEEKYYRGVGMAIGAHGNGVFGAHRDVITLTLKLNEDGTATLITGVHDMGNGVATMQTMMVSEVLGIRPEDVETYEADTDACTFNLGDYASRGVFVEGAGAKKTAEKLKEMILDEAEKLMEVPKENLILEDGLVVNKEDKNQSKTLSDVAVFTQSKSLKELSVVESFSSPAGITSYGVHFAEVLVDKETKKVKVENFVAVHDVGTVINPMNLEGQLEGGIHMGLGYALSEEVSFDEKGVPLNDEFTSYKMLRANEMPDIKIHFVDGFEKDGPYGGKSIGECAVVPSAPAVANAVLDATGIEVHSLPIKL